MKIFSQSFLLPCFLLLASLAYPNITLHIPYAGGKQTGVFKIWGDGHRPQENDFADTAIIDSSVLIAYFVMSKSFTQCSYVPSSQYGLLMKIQNGQGGKKREGDTMWTSAQKFPDSLFSLDRIPLPGYGNYSSQDSANPSRGLNVAILTTDGVCIPDVATMIQGYNSVLYFKYNRGSGERYVKMMVQGYQFVNSHIINGPKSNLTMAYSISDSKDINTGPVGIYLLKLKNGNHRLFSDDVFDLNGRLQKPSVRVYPVIPLLPAEQ